MANAQILFVVRGAISADSLRSAVETAGRAAGFSPGPSTYASGSSTAIRQGITGVFSAGPWLGFEFDGSTLPTVPSNVEWSAFRMNLIGGPDGSEALNAVASALAAMPSMIRLASRSPRNAISWDRAVPAPIPLAESTQAPASSGAWFVGLLAVAGLAWNASRATGSVSGGPTSYGRPKFAGLDGVRRFQPGDEVQARGGRKGQVSQSGRKLRVMWEDGRESSISAQRVRRVRSLRSMVAR